MKKTAFVLLCIIFLCGLGLTLHAQENDNKDIPEISEAESIDAETGEEEIAASPLPQAKDDYYQEYDPDKSKRTETSAAAKKDSTGVLYTLSYGGSASWLIRRRIESETITLPDLDENGEPVEVEQTVKNNLSYMDFFPGLYINVEMYNVKNLFKDIALEIIPAFRLAAYYPLNFAADTSTVNKKPQRAENSSHFGIDMLLGVKLELFELNFIRMNLTPGLHMLYLSSDQWNYFNLGFGLMLGFGIPLNEKMTFLVNGCISVDSGNLGNNRSEAKFDSCAQYQVDIGFCYSTKKLNNFSISGPKKPKKDSTVQYDDYD